MFLFVIIDFLNWYGVIPFPPSDFWNNQKKFVFICQERAFIYFQKRETASNFVKTGATPTNRNTTEDFTKDRATATGRKNSLSSLLNCCLPIDNTNSYRLRISKKQHWVGIIIPLYDFSYRRKSAYIWIIPVFLKGSRHFLYLCTIHSNG